jgi:hypothetical protein
MQPQSGLVLLDISGRLGVVQRPEMNHPGYKTTLDESSLYRVLFHTQLLITLRR